MVGPARGSRSADKLGLTFPARYAFFLRVIPPFQVFLEQQREVVFRYLVARVGPTDADDVFQETFTAALRAYPRLAPGANLRAWVLRIAERKAVDAHRARARRPIPSHRLPAAAADGHVERDPEVWGAVRRLPAKQKTALLQRYVVGLRYREIGEISGTSEAAARQTVAAARRTLREALRA